MKKYTRTTVLAALGVAAALSLTACGGDDADAGKDSSGKGVSSSPSEPSEPSEPSGSSGSSGSAKGGSSSDGSGTGSATSDAGDTEARAGKNGAGRDAQGVEFCEKSGLSMTAKDEGLDQASGNVVVTMTNTTGATCSVTGFPTVKLTDADNTTSAPLERDKNEPRVAVLKPNEKAVFNISFDKSKGGEPGDSDPVEMRVAPPKGSSFVTLHWPAGAIKGMSNDTALVHPTHANP